jgi:hypothetical protein
MTDVLGQRFSVYSDVVAARDLTLALQSKFNYTAADRVARIQQNYVSAWDRINSTMNFLDPVRFPQLVYNLEQNAWNLASDGSYTQNPSYNQDRIQFAAVNRLMFEP